METGRGKKVYKRLMDLSTPDKKRRKVLQQRKSNAARIGIGDQIERWNQLRERLHLQSNAVLAKLLLDRFEEMQPTVSHMSGPTSSSTPKTKPPELTPSEEVPVGDTGSDISDIEPLEGDPLSEAAASTSKESPAPSQLDISVEYEVRGDHIYPQEFGSDGDSDEWDERNSDISEELNMSHPEGMETVMVDEVFDVDTSSNLQDQPSEGSDIDDDTSTQTLSDISKCTTFLTYESCLLQLIREVPSPTKCSNTRCSLVPEATLKTVGTALSVKWVCSRGHISKRWDSQPKIKRNNAGDVALSAAIILSGNNYAKIAMLLKCMNMGVVHSALHLTIQRDYTFPAINTYWEGIQAALLKDRQGKDVVISGDGRNDSPGHTAQYCTYTTMDYHTGDILDIRIVDKRETELNSVVMEKMAFLHMLEFLKANGLNVKEVVTDAHVQITAFLKQFPEIFHSYDVWHGAKNIGKKVAEAAKKASNRPLLKWTGDVTKHFWYCAKNADDNTLRFLSQWRGLLHHVVGNHEWALGDGGGPAACEHGPLPDDWKEKILDEDSPAHNALRGIVLDERLLGNLHHYQRFRHTGQLENFQSHILAYAAKRFAYGPPSYKARNRLAAIDYQHHKNRSQKVSNGEPKFTRAYSKSSARWKRVPVMESKDYSYVPDLMLLVLQQCASDANPQRRSLVLEEGDPRRLAPTIRPSHPPSVPELVQSHTSRM